MENLLGMMEAEALTILKEKGLDFTVKKTAPPRASELEKYDKRYPRVIKQDVEGGVYRLIVSMVPDDFWRLD